MLLIKKTKKFKHLKSLKTKIMKKIYSIIAALFLVTFVLAQSPNKMSYQAVIRDNSNALVTSQIVGMQISILQGSANGTAVYAETQTATTNTNGLISIEIGGGTVVSGNFSTIDWANGPYFIKTETDPAGGTNYTITGTSQLLSVPYALHASTAGNGLPVGGSAGQVLTLCNGIATWTNSGQCPGNITALNCGLATNNGTLTSGLAASGVSSVVSFSGGNGGAHSGQTVTSTGVIGLTATLAAGTFANGTGSLTYTITGTPLTAGTASFALSIGGQSCNLNWTVVLVGTPTIGLSFGGGIIAYILQPSDSGYDANVLHGLIAAPSDQSVGTEWGCSMTTIIGADGTAIGTGNQNTVDIMNGCTTAGIAARICGDLMLNGYSDWFLPSLDELSLLYWNIGPGALAPNTNVGGFGNIPSCSYWSSSELASNTAWTYNFYFGTAETTSTKPLSRYVRAVRAF